MSCDQNSQIVSLNLDTVTKEDEGWYFISLEENVSVQHFSLQLKLYGNDRGFLGPQGMP